jgi:hypothetical protein
MADSESYDKVSKAIGEASQAFWQTFWENLSKGDLGLVSFAGVTSAEAKAFVEQVGGFDYQLFIARKDLPSVGSKSFGDKVKSNPAGLLVSGEISFGGTIRF